MRGSENTVKMTGIDYEFEYNNRARVPENSAIMAGWAKDAAAYREQRPLRSIAYGPGSRNTNSSTSRVCIHVSSTLSRP